MGDENIVKRACRELGITQAELGRKLDIPPSTISTWASGQIPRIAEIALGLMIENKQQREIIEAIKRAKEALERA